MTPIRPTERRVRGVMSDRYPPNVICAHPTCTDPAQDPHHIFARGWIGNDSWFVEYEEPLVGDPRAMPHVAGLCRKHHDALEEHRAWIKLEADEFRWYVRKEDEWLLLGPLNPQPGSREGKPKRKRYEGQQRRARRVVSLSVPADRREDGAGILDDLHEQVEERLGHDPPRPLYYTTVDAFVFVLANADATDV